MEIKKKKIDYIASDALNALETRKTSQVWIGNNRKENQKYK